MKITEIIKDAFIFPSKNTGRYAIYLLLSVLVSLFALGGLFTNAFGIINAENYLTGGFYFIISLLIVILICGYHIKVVKSGINRDEELPVFKLFDDFMVGVDNFLVIIFYYMIPALIAVVVGFDTNLFGKAIAVCQEFLLQVFNVYILGNSANIAANAVSNTVTDFMGSFVVTITVALILFAIFSFILSIAEARLAYTGSLKEALNIFGSLKDMKRIGVAKVIIVLILIVIIIAIIEIILTLVFNKFPFLLSTFGIVISPYFILVSQRAIGLLYSDIA